jgi:hypothetical protein
MLCYIFAGLENFGEHRTGMHHKSTEDSKVGMDLVWLHVDGERRGYAFRASNSEPGTPAERQTVNREQIRSLDIDRADNEIELNND